MRYILLDFEWNNTYSVPLKRFINEIMEIGAVMLNDAFEVIDTFESVIRSALTKRLRSGFTELTGITNERMLAGKPFLEAVESYRNWARVGDDTITLTWSNSDLYAITENCENFLPEGASFPIGNYVDLQGFVQQYLKEKGVELTGQISLAKAAQLLEIETDEMQLHTARYDSYVCAALLKKTFDAEGIRARVQHTDTPDYFKRLTFKPHYLSSVNAIGKKSEELRFTCTKCGEFAKRTSKWRYHNRWLQANFRCLNCGNRFGGRIMLKQTYDDLIVCKRIVPLVAKRKKKEAQVEHGEVQRLPETV